jgi:hypothetical protein
MTNKEIAAAVIKGTKNSHRVTDFKRATAIRLAGHRLGAVLTAKSEKGGWRLVKSSARKRKKIKAAE